MPKNKRNIRGAALKRLDSVSRRREEMLKYTTYFYDKSRPTGSDFCSNPTQEFYSLEEARTFSQRAAEMGRIQKVRSFRIETDDGKINEHWIRAAEGWKLSR